jgi:hypothetical protein
MTTSATGNTSVRRLRRTTAGVLTMGLATAGLAALGAVAAAPADAATVNVIKANFTWSLNNETLAGAFAPGTWNLMSAGTIGNPGAGGQTLKSADEGATWGNGEDAGWTNTSGNVTIEDKLADGTYAPTTFLGTKQNSAGQNTSGASTTILSENRMVVKNGTGTIDPATDSASIAWSGDATVLFYSGMTYFTLSDPELSLSNGTGEVTATLGGYATSMDDTTVWEPVTPEEVTLATLSGVDVTEAGLTATPAYREVTYTVPSGSSAQVTTGASWGSFPQSFVDFQQQLGQGPYWYSTGGTADPRKVANPLTVDFSTPSVTVSKTTLLPNGAQQVTVTGKNFDPTLSGAPANPPGLSSGGVYVTLGRFASTWKPSAGATSGARSVLTQLWALPPADRTSLPSGTIDLGPDGSFTATFTVDKADFDALTANPDGGIGIYTYTRKTDLPSFETFTPITFAKAAPTVTVTAPAATYGSSATATVKVASDGGGAGAVTLYDGATALGTKDTVDGVAAFDLGTGLATGAHSLRAVFAGNDNVEAGEATGTLTVGKAAAAITVEAPQRTYGQATTATVTVTGAGTAGAVTLTGAGEPVQAELANGTATFDLGSLGAGTHTLTASYAGNANAAAATGSVTTTVAKAASTTTAKVAKKPTTKKAGQVKVAVKSGTAGVVDGTVKVVVRNAKGKVVEKLKAAELTKGAASVKLPKLKAGKYKLVATFVGDDNVKGSSRKVSFKVR